jgi:hypothetical protein
VEAQKSTAEAEATQTRGARGAQRQEAQTVELIVISVIFIWHQQQQ